MDPKHIKINSGEATRGHPGCELRPAADEPAAFAGHRPVRGLHCASTASVLYPTSFRTCDQRSRRHLSTPRLVRQSGHTHGGQSTALRSRGRSRVTSNRSIMVPAGTRRARIDDHIGAELRVPRTRCPSWELGRCVTERVPRRAAGAELHAPPPCSTSQLGCRVTAGALRRQGGFSP